MKGRKAPPSHYTFKIKSFSWLSKALVQNCTSEEFEAGGYQWSLSIYPTGNRKRGGEGYISIYLMLMDPSSLPLGWEVKAIVNFSAYNFIDDEYVTTQDTDVKRFHVLKTEWGIDKFMDIDIFNDPAKGYVMEDTCVFGAEVFVVKTTNKGNCLSMIGGPISTVLHSWKFSNFSLAKLGKYESEPFVVGDYKWNLVLCPNGIIEGKGNSISLFLVVEVSTLSPNIKVVVEYTLRAKDQISGHHAETRFCTRFSSSASIRGTSQLVALAKFKDPKNGFLVNDTCIFEAELRILGLMTLN